VFGKNKLVSKSPRGLELPPPTQEHVHVRAVEPPGFLIADDGTIAGAVVVDPVDLALADAQQRRVWQEMFGRFIGGLQHKVPIQIVVGTRPQRCDEYRDRVRERISRFEALAEEARAGSRAADEQRRTHMAEIAQAHLSLFEVLLDEMRPREETYLVVVWHNPFPILKGRRQLSADKLEEGKKEVERKLGLVASGLQHIGLNVRRAEVEDLEGVVFNFYHMTTSPLARLVRPAVLVGTIPMPGDEGRQEAVWDS
jgi:hypothetical protein